MVEVLAGEIGVAFFCFRFDPSDKLAATISQNLAKFGKQFSKILFYCLRAKRVPVTFL